MRGICGVIRHRRGVRFDMREEYTGPLAGLIMKSIPDLNPSFVRFAQGLNHQAER